MKQLNILFGIILTTSILFFSQSCEKDDDENSNGGGNNTLTFTDSRDGQTYKYVQIGNQVWMAENLNYETDTGSWVYNDSNQYAETYGRLYNWCTACEICPDGWHLPSDAEWTELTDYLGDDAGGKLKATGTIEAGTGLWFDPNEGATNESGFSALPGGYRSSYGFYGMGNHAYFWSSSEGDSGTAWGRRLASSIPDVYHYYDDTGYGFSVRCVRNLTP
jgi:uncharacterized protein (TIGR02145 family)